MVVTQKEYKKHWKTKKHKNSLVKKFGLFPFKTTSFYSLYTGVKFERKRAASSKDKK